MSKTFQLSKHVLPVLLAITLMLSLFPVFSFTASAAVQYYSVTGPVTDSTMNTITIMSGTGKLRTFTKDNAWVKGAPDGIAIGDTIKIVYNISDKTAAVQIIMIAHGGNHVNIEQEEITHYSFTGWVSDMDDDGYSFTVQDLKNGREKDFEMTDRTRIVNSDDDTIQIGDVVRVTYHGERRNIAERITMVDEGNNH